MTKEEFDEIINDEQFIWDTIANDNIFEDLDYNEEDIKKISNNIKNYYKYENYKDEDEDELYQEIFYDIENYFGR